MTIPGPDEPDYGNWFAVVQDATRYDLGGTPAMNPGDAEALLRLTTGPFPIADLDGFDQGRLRSAVAWAIARGQQGKLSQDEAVHAALDGLRAEGVPVPPRPPDDPLPDLTL